MSKTIVDFDRRGVAILDAMRRPKPTGAKPSNEVCGKRPGMTEAGLLSLRKKGRIEHEGRTYLITDLAYSVTGDGLLDVVWFGTPAAEALPVLL